MKIKRIAPLPAAAEKNLAMQEQQLGGFRRQKKVSEGWLQKFTRKLNRLQKAFSMAAGGTANRDVVGATLLARVQRRMRRAQGDR